MMHQGMEEEEAEPLPMWLRKNTAPTPSGNITISRSEIEGMNDGKEEVDESEESETSVNIDNYEGFSLQTDLSSNNLRVDDKHILELENSFMNYPGNAKDVIMSSFNISTRMLMPTSREDENKGKMADLGEESDEEIIELELERAGEKVHTHSPYCPNCKSPITKVLCRTRKREGSVPSSADSHRTNCSDIDCLRPNPPSKVINGGHDNEQEVDKNRIIYMRVHFKNDEVITLQWRLSHNNPRLGDAYILELASSVFNSLGNVKDVMVSNLDTPSLEQTLSEEEDIGRRGGVNETVMINLVEESDEEFIELEFESAVEKVHTHSLYCPNCRSRITKVILRGRKRKESICCFGAASHFQDAPHVFRCMTCLTSEHCPNPLNIFGSKRKQEITGTIGDKHTLEANLPVTAGGSTNSEGSKTIKKGNAFDLFWIFRKRRENENAHDSQDGSSNGATAPVRPGSEIKDEQSNKSQRHQEADEEIPVKSTADRWGEIDADVAKQPAISGERTEIVEDKQTSEVNLSVCPGGPTNVKGSTTTKQGGISEGATTSLKLESKTSEEHFPKSQQLPDDTSERATSQRESESEITEQRNRKSQLLLGNDEDIYEVQSIDYEYAKPGLTRSRLTKIALGLRNDFQFVADSGPLYQLHASTGGREYLVSLRLNLKPTSVTSSVATLTI